MPFTLEDDLAEAAGPADLSLEQTMLVLALGLFAEGQAALAQAAAVAELDRLAF